MLKRVNKLDSVRFECLQKSGKRPCRDSQRTNAWAQLPLARPKAAQGIQNDAACWAVNYSDLSGIQSNFSKLY